MSARYRPNSSLTTEEREAKRQSKRKLRTMVKVNKLETRIRHAISRRDPLVEREARDELRKLRDSLALEDPVKSPSLPQVHEGTREGWDGIEYAKDVITAITQQLFEKGDQKTITQLFPEFRKNRNDPQESISKAECWQKISSQVPGTEILVSKEEIIECGTVECDKEEQHRRALQLLRHMSKGTQSVGMFCDVAALRGYARQKFRSRALLVCTSILKLRPGSGGSLSPQQEKMRSDCWRTELPKIRSICSIGCGPGCDVVGLLSLLHAYRKLEESAKERILLDDRRLRVTMLDWAIDQWSGAVLKDLESVLVEDGLIAAMRMGRCDVTKPLNSAEKDQTAEISLKLSTASDHRCADSFDIYLISYLLSETRGKWDNFFVTLIERAKPGAMFYFAEPTPWQLHRLIELCGYSMNFLWLDSSMHKAEMQTLDGRVGPAVLFGTKKWRL